MLIYFSNKIYIFFSLLPFLYQSSLWNMWLWRIPYMLLLYCTVLTPSSRRHEVPMNHLNLSGKQKDHHYRHDSLLLDLKGHAQHITCDRLP